MADCMTPKPQGPRIYRSYSANMCTFVPKQGGRKKTERERAICVLCSLFGEFKTLVSFPEAAAFA